MSAVLLSIQSGRVLTRGADDDPQDLVWTTAFFKSPVIGPVQMDEQGIVGDEQADRVHHGGCDKAVLLYSAEHFREWAAELGVAEISAGGFGENLTITGLDEAGVCIGDRWQFGPVVLEVSQPRQPCWKLGRRWQRPDLVQRVVATGRTGWYARVVTGGEILAPMAGVLLARPHAEWTVQRANRAFYGRRSDPTSANELALLPELAHVWREVLLAERA